MPAAPAERGWSRKPISVGDSAATVPSVREFLRGAMRLHVLHHAATGEIHGAWMSEELARHGYRISAGTLYPALHRMEREGLLVDRRAVVAGHTRRVYRATAKGRAVLAQTRRALRELADEVLE